MYWQLSAIEAAQRIRDGLLTSEDLVKSCLERIDETDGGIGAWTCLDRDLALDQARAMDRIRQRGLPMGPLHGIPVGIKDIFDTADMPTECGSPIRKGRRPDRDAIVVSRLKEAGAVILGKTVTTEFAFLHPAETRNPHDASRIPGGSSSGSAAGVAAGHMPLAIGSQTGGSTIRPASYCGIYGFKPTRGMVGRTGCLQTSVSLDTVGTFARTLEDIALLTETISGHDADDVSSYARPRPQMLARARSEPAVDPDFAWFDLSYNSRLDADAREGLEELLDALGARVERLPAPKSFDTVLACHQVVHEVEISRHLEQDFATGWDLASDSIKPVIERAKGYSEAQYQDALAMLQGAEDYFAQFFNDYDAIVTPAATGEAPLHAGHTGDPVFCKIWTSAGLPSLSMPLLTGENGLPVGVQLVGAAEADDRLLRTAGWLLRQLDDTLPDEETPE